MHEMAKERGAEPRRLAYTQPYRYTSLRRSFYPGQLRNPSLGVSIADVIRGFTFNLGVDRVSGISRAIRKEDRHGSSI